MAVEFERSTANEPYPWALVLPEMHDGCGSVSWWAGTTVNRLLFRKGVRCLGRTSAVRRQARRLFGSCRNRVVCLCKECDRWNATRRSWMGSNGLRLLGLNRVGEGNVVFTSQLECCRYFVGGRRLVCNEERGGSPGIDADAGSHGRLS